MYQSNISINKNIKTRKIETKQTYQIFLPVMHILIQGIAYFLFPSLDTASQYLDGLEALESQLHDTFSLSSPCLVYFCL